MTAVAVGYKDRDERSSSEFRVSSLEPIASHTLDVSLPPWLPSTTLLSPFRLLLRVSLPRLNPLSATPNPILSSVLS